MDSPSQMRWLWECVVGYVAEPLVESWHRQGRGVVIPLRCCGSRPCAGLPCALCLQASSRPLGSPIASRPACSVVGHALRWRSVSDVRNLRTIAGGRLGGWSRHRRGRPRRQARTRSLPSELDLVSTTTRRVYSAVHRTVRCSTGRGRPQGEGRLFGHTRTCLEARQGVIGQLGF